MSILQVELKVQSKGASKILKNIVKILEDPEQLKEPDIARVFDIQIDGNSLTFQTTQRDGYGGENAVDIAIFLAKTFRNKITGLNAIENGADCVLWLEDEADWEDWVANQVGKDFNDESK